MKNLLIIYNCIFLFVGNVLFSSIHYLHHHHHSDELHENHECDECILIDSSNNYTSNIEEINFSNNNSNEFVVFYLTIVDINTHKSCPARSPPFSL